MPREHPLKRVERALKVAPRHRLDLIEEVDADVRALQAELERRGSTPARARGAARRRLVPGQSTIEELSARHAPPLGRWVRAADWVDRVVPLGVGLAAASAGLLAVIAMHGSGVAGAAAFAVWPQAIVIAALAANLSWAGAQLWIHGDLRSMQRRLLWTRQAGLVVAAIALGALGAAWEGRLGLAPTEPVLLQGWEPQLWEAPVWQAIDRMATVAGTGLGAAVFGLFGWLGLTPRLLTDEEAERRIAHFFADARPLLTLSGHPRTRETSLNHE